MPSPLQLITIYTTRRYNENRDRRPRLARAYLAIINKAADVQLSGGDMAELCAFLSAQHRDADLARASRDVLEHVAAF